MTDRSDSEFWHALESLVRSSPIKVDRPKGSAHPRFGDIVYPLDYGYLEGTAGGDGNGIDVWLGGSGDRTVTGVVLTIDLLKRDAEQKLLLGCSHEEATKIAAFHRSNRQYSRLLWRSA